MTIPIDQRELQPASDGLTLGVVAGATRPGGVALVNDGPACANALIPAVQLLQLVRLKFESRSDRQE